MDTAVARLARWAIVAWQALFTLNASESFIAQTSAIPWGGKLICCPATVAHAVAITVQAWQTVTAPKTFRAGFVRDGALLGYARLRGLPLKERVSDTAPVDPIRKTNANQRTANSDAYAYGTINDAVALRVKLGRRLPDCHVSKQQLDMGVLLNYLSLFWCPQTMDWNCAGWTVDWAGQ